MKYQISALAAALLTMASSASAQTYHCNFKVPGGNGIVPREVLVEFQGAEQAEVTDPLLLKLEQAPKKAKFAQNTDKRMRVRWTLEDLPGSGGEQVDVQYSLGFNKKRNRADITLNVVGFDNTDSGNGSCEVVK